MIFFFPLFSCSLLREENLIPPLVIDIPVSVVFIGTHKLLDEDLNEFTSKIKEDWFIGLNHERIHREVNKSKFFYITPDAKKKTSIKYNYKFVVVDLPKDDHVIFEKSMEKLKRPYNKSGTSTLVHPYPVEKIFQSLIDYYKIPGYVFFIYAASSSNQTYCEGIFKDEVFHYVNVTQQEIKFQPGKPWAHQMQDLLNQPSFLGGWSSASQVYSQIRNDDSLSQELINNTIQPLNSCGMAWASNKRFLWADLSKRANKSLNTQIKPKFPSLPNILTLYEKLCNPQNESSYCKNLSTHIKTIQERVPNEFSTAVSEFNAISSSVILNALYTVINPKSPLFNTAIPNKLDVELTHIGIDKTVNTSLLQKALKSYSLGFETKVTHEVMPLAAWPSFMISLFSSLTNHKINMFNGINASLFREHLQNMEVSHDLQGNNTRTLVGLIYSYNSTNPILLNNISSSIAFDWVSFEIAQPGHFDPLSLLRSMLVHLYGLHPYNKWKSMSIMSLSSFHYELGQISKDAAIRNSLRYSLGKIHDKTIRQIDQLDRLISLNPSNFSSAAIINQIVPVAHAFQEVLDMASNFEFEQMWDSFTNLKVMRKELSKMLKKSIQGLKDQLCMMKPPKEIMKEPSLLDNLDEIAMYTFPIWFLVFFVSFTVTLYAVYTSMKKLS